MADDFIQRSAAATWELIIVEWGRVGIIVYDVFMNNPVDFLSGDTYSYRFMAKIQSFSSNLAGYS